MLSKLIRRVGVLAVAAVVLALSACHDDDDDHHRHEDPDFEIPAGGQDFGAFNHFEHDFAARTIDSAGDQDGFTFTLNYDSAVMLTITGQAGFDGFIDLYDQDLFFIAGDDDGGPGPDAVLIIELLAGDYIVIVGGSGPSVGDYDFDITVGTLGGLDFGILSPGSSYIDDDGDIADAGDTDCFFFTVLDDERLDFRLTRLSGDYDGNLQLINEYGEEVGFDDPGGAANPTLLDMDLTPGTYMLVVGANSGGGNYRLRIDVE